MKVKAILAQVLRNGFGTTASAISTSHPAAKDSARTNG